MNRLVPSVRGAGRDRIRAGTPGHPQGVHLDVRMRFGIPAVLHSLDISAGRGTWLATTGCPAARRWPWKALGRFTNGQRITTDEALACRPAHTA